MKHGPDIGGPGFDLIVKAKQSKLQVYKSWQQFVSGVQVISWPPATSDGAVVNQDTHSMVMVMMMITTTMTMMTMMMMMMKAIGT